MKYESKWRKYIERVSQIEYDIPHDLSQLA